MEMKKKEEEEEGSVFVQGENQVSDHIHNRPFCLLGGPNHSGEIQGEEASGCPGPARGY